MSWNDVDVLEPNDCEIIRLASTLFGSGDPPNGMTRAL